MIKKKKEEEVIDKKIYSRTQSCRNCGVNGHLYKDCPHPIISLGIICYKIDDNNNIKYLMIQRKDSLSFMEFVRGKYDVNDLIYLKKLLSAMTLNEKNMILKKNFDEIWNYVWCQSLNSNIKYTKEYIDSKQKYDYIMINSTFINIINNLIKNTSICEQEWGFPKGRRKLKESDLNCAIREFCEETRLLPDDIIINNDIIPFEEIFFGTNNILYKHSYYIAKLNKTDSTLSLDPKCLDQIREVRALQWFSYDEVLLHIKKHNVERIEIFKQVNLIINELNNNEQNEVLKEVLNEVLVKEQIDELKK
jgi:8-oxo-dGTP pyrophosphatase MutT (NUDIX family)